MATDPKDTRPTVPQYVLLVEDNMIIALDTEEILEQIGVERVEVESNVKGALATIARGAPDFAILDYNLDEESCEPVASELSARGVPFILATGHSQDFKALEALGAIGVMTKPYNRAKIEQALVEQGAG